MTPHDLIKHNARHYECCVCGQTWKTKPKAKCPGLKVYPNHHYQPLMTKDQLGYMGYMGYQASEKALPSPVGCYYSHATGTYIKLYDPSQAIKRQGRLRPRITSIVTEVTWPVSLLPLLQTFSAFLKDRPLHLNDGSYAERVNEIANIVIQLVTFSPDELEQFAGPCVRFILSPCLTRRYYSSFQTNEQEQVKLVSHLAAAYERHKDGLSTNSL